MFPIEVEGEFVEVSIRFILCDHVLYSYKQCVLCKAFILQGETKFAVGGGEESVIASPNVGCFLRLIFKLISVTCLSCKVVTCS